MNNEVKLYVSLRNNFFNITELNYGEMRTLAFLLSQREDFVIYENKTAEQQSVSVRTMERRFKRLLELGYLKKIFKCNSKKYKKNFDWKLTTKATYYKASVGQKYYTRFKKSFIMDATINDFDWAVLSVILTNHKNYKNYATTIRDELNISTQNRSRLTKSIQRLEEKELIFKNTDNEGKLFYSANDTSSNFIIQIDRRKYETQSEKIQRNIDTSIKRLCYVDYIKQKSEMNQKRLIEFSWDDE